MNPEPEIDWKVFKLILLACPALFLVVAIARGSWTTVIPLALFAFIIASLFVFRRGRSRAVTLHISIALLLVYQTSLLKMTVAEPNIGVVWFLAVPAPTTTCSSRPVHLSCSRPSSG